MHEVRSLRTKMRPGTAGTGKRSARFWLPGHRVSEETEEEEEEEEEKKEEDEE